MISEIITYKKLINEIDFPIIPYLVKEKLEDSTFLNHKVEKEKSFYKNTLCIENIEHCSSLFKNNIVSKIVNILTIKEDKKEKRNLDIFLSYSNCYINTNTAIDKIIYNLIKSYFETLFQIIIEIKQITGNRKFFKIYNPFKNNEFNDFLNDSILKNLKITGTNTSIIHIGLNQDDIHNIINDYLLKYIVQIRIKKADFAKNSGIITNEVNSIKILFQSEKKFKYLKEHIVNLEDVIKDLTYIKPIEKTHQNTTNTNSLICDNKLKILTPQQKKDFNTLLDYLLNNNKQEVEKLSDYILNDNIPLSKISNYKFTIKSHANTFCFFNEFFRGVLLYTSK